MAVAVAPGSPDFAVRMSEPVRKQMPGIRTCFGQAMVRSAQVQGRAVFEVEALAHGRSRARITSNRTGDQEMVECMRASLAQVGFQGVPRGVRSLITLDLTNSSAQSQLGARVQEVESPVKALPDGHVQSEGSTQQGEVQFRISGAAGARDAIESLHGDVSQRFAGLLDCRRKSSRKNHPATGTITLKLSIQEGKVTKMRSKADRSVGYKAPGCVMEWLGRAERTHLRPAEVELAITFGKD